MPPHLRRALAALVLLAACAGDADKQVSQPEICDDGVDNDLDGFVDCDDSDCFVDCIEQCGNGVDDDDNGLVDCRDPACFGGLCSEICDDGGDNDLDGEADCADSDCASECPEICDDGRDNDGDLDEDCDDADCDSTCDADGDGVIAEAYGGEDCDDFDAANYPGNEEICDDQDNDCDGQIDDADTDVSPSTSYFIDADQDGYGGPLIDACEPPAYSTTVGGDCDDTDGAVNPDALEVCNTVDDDCDGQIDDDDPTVDPSTFTTWYPDNDGDGWGDVGPSIDQCSPPAYHVDNDDDCNDSNPTILGSEPWLRDNDNDGFGAGTPSPASCTQPQQGYVRESAGIDCNDGDPLAYPGATEICGDGLDQDCDGIDPLCVIDNAASLERAGTAIVDAAAGTYDGEEIIRYTGNASGFVYCEYTYVAQDWDHAPAAVGADPYTLACTDDMGNPCEFQFTVVIDQGVTTLGDVADCEGFYGRTSTAAYSPSGYGYHDAWISSTGANLGPHWAYYDSVNANWFPVRGDGLFDVGTGEFSYSSITDTGLSVPP